MRAKLLESPCTIGLCVGGLKFGFLLLVWTLVLVAWPTSPHGASTTGSRPHVRPRLHKARSLRAEAGPDVTDVADADGAGDAHKTSATPVTPQPDADGDWHGDRDTDRDGEHDRDRDGEHDIDRDDEHEGEDDEEDYPSDGRPPIYMNGTLPDGTYEVHGNSPHGFVLTRKKHHHHRDMSFSFFVVEIIRVAIIACFAFIYKDKVVNGIPPLRQQPMSTMQDFSQGIYQCFVDQQMCLHSFFCCAVRAAHTWHVAGLCEYWPSLFLIFLVDCTKWACCLDACVFTYFRMKLKQKLGIEPDLMMDFVFSAFCPWCAVAQEAMAVDEELGVTVECCCQSYLAGRHMPQQPLQQQQHEQQAADDEEPYEQEAAQSQE